MPYLSLLLFVVLVVALIDIIGTDDALIRGLPKIGWVLVVVILPLIGALAWLAVGRPVADDVRGSRHGQTSEFPEYDRPGRYVPADPEADREFLEGLRARAEEQRRRARDQERERARRDDSGNDDQTS
ncbi:PLDc_N domain-containing protein [Gordonia sp. TBRC 11910]|uniref:PLDc_N domain-containing protein n=1 Tax=Gordonia asplenii TaxID=2725283 RepID=A0A848KTL9_9ACTN|nr:PLD nuclease N-terminal domain-containing protein [Gordonia asplenii]NMO00225.1 PLDc_N domain-containing protein [Gordonia asplenii]